jgi:tetratricopeptide (TPR) repeat protein
MKIWISIQLIFILTFNVKAQTDYFKLADEYFKMGEFDKAVDMYEDIVVRPENLPKVYTNYLFSLNQLHRYTESEKLIKTMIKYTQPDNAFYKIDLAICYRNLNNEEKSKKEFQHVVNENKKNEIQVKRLGNYCIQLNELLWAEQLYLEARKNFSRYAFCYELAAVYKLENKTNLFIEELLNLIQSDPTQLESVQQSFQNQISTEEDFFKLEEKIYLRINEQPNEIVYNKLLYWLCIQQKEFSRAFTQAKALDYKTSSNGMYVKEMADIAFENKVYEAAIEAYQYIIQSYPQLPELPMIKRKKIMAREQQLLNVHPVKEESVKWLIQDYNQLIQQNGLNPYTIESLKNIALLNAFYLQKRDTAFILLNQLLASPYADKKLKGKSKLDLGDIYLLDAQPWESTLLYSQVEKDFKEDPLGHEAKLRNAKLYYYKGEFLLAQEQLDVLKLATSREIANDAIHLSVFILDNIGLDTVETALKKYAQIDLLVFQKQYQAALEASQQLYEAYKTHPIADECLWLQANIYRQLGQFTLAEEQLKKIISGYAQDILADDAQFLLAQIYEYDLNNKDLAIATYQDLLIQHSNSLYALDARTRIRFLRGDKN